MFEQLKANKLPINHVWKLGLDVEKKRYWTVFLAAESVPWLRMTDWAWLSDQTTQPWHTHTHKINLRRSLFCLVKERKKPAPAYITRYPGNGGDETISRFWLVKLELLKPRIHNSRLIMSCAPECSSWGFVEPLEYFLPPRLSWMRANSSSMRDRDVKVSLEWQRGQQLLGKDLELFVGSIIQCESIKVH